MIYFDNAATTFPKPPSVINEINNCLNLYCGNPGRSGHSLSIRAAEKIYECRESLAEMFGFSNPTNVVFTPNTTYALNIAIKSRDASFVLPFEKAARGIVISWILQRNSGRL